MFQLFSPSKKLQLQNELLSPQKTLAASVSQERPLISPRKVFVSPIKSPSKVSLTVFIYWVINCELSKI